MFTGPRFGPASGQAPRQLVIFLHGVGADGNDLIALAPYFARALPDALFLSPDAPFPCDMAPMGRQWFSLLDYSPPAILAGVRSVAPWLDTFIDDALTETGLSDGALALVGFSQGTMMALQVALRRPHPCAALLGYSGRLVAPELLAGEIVSRPPALLIHGEDDDVLPAANLPVAEQALRAAGVTVAAKLLPALGHGINEEGIMLGMVFLKHHLAKV